MSGKTSTTQSPSSPSALPAAEGIGSGPRKNRSKKLLLVLALLSLIAFGAVAGGLYWSRDKGSSDTISESSQVAELKEQIRNEDDPEAKASLYTDLSAAQQLDGNLDAAIEASKESAEISASVNSYAQLAFLYEENKEYELAIEYYDKAASLSEPTDNTDARTDYNYYKARAEDLRSQQ